MATITEAHHIAIVLRALARHGVTQPGTAVVAESLAYLDDRAAKALQIQRILPADLLEQVAGEIAQRAADAGHDVEDGPHECSLCRGQACPCSSGDECGHYCPNDPAVA